MNNPLVSVIIPVYNGERYLAQTIESALAQTYQPIEIIVINDGSTDGSAEVVKRFPSVRYHFQENRGIGGAKNSGIELAKGDFLAILEQDDLWSTNKITQQMAAFEGDPALDIVFGHVKQFHSPELGEAIKAKLHYNEEIIAGYHAGSMLVKREAFFRVGWFDTNCRVGEFLDWYLRATEKNLKSLMLPDILMQRRLHTTNTIVREKKSHADFVHILKASLKGKTKRRCSA
jgi:glycosyltransferase involved in cell wall biosynthesis